VPLDVGDRIHFFRSCRCRRRRTCWTNPVGMMFGADHLWNATRPPTGDESVGVRHGIGTGVRGQRRAGRVVLVISPLPSGGMTKSTVRAGDNRGRPRRTSTRPKRLRDSSASGTGAGSIVPRQAIPGLPGGAGFSAAGERTATCGGRRAGPWAWAGIRALRDGRRGGLPVVRSRTGATEAGPSGSSSWVERLWWPWDWAPRARRPDTFLGVGGVVWGLAAAAAGGRLRRRRRWPQGGTGRGRRRGRRRGRWGRGGGGVAGGATEAGRPCRRRGSVSTGVGWGWVWVEAPWAVAWGPRRDPKPGGHRSGAGRAEPHDRARRRRLGRGEEARQDQDVEEQRMPG
jgi:hypothetical protein